jgi:hypothetical protein
MTNTQFYKFLLFTVGGSAIGYQLLVLFFNILEKSQDFFWLLQFFYAGLCIGFFYLGKTALRSKNINLFSQIIILFILTKLLFSIMLFVAYSVIKRPTGTSYMIPFILNYLIYTVFGTFILTKLGKQKSDKSVK